MNELLHKFKLGYDAELLLEKRGGGYEKVATVPIGSQALGVTQSAQRIRFPLNADIYQRSAISSPLKIALIGDSITECKVPTFKWVKGASGYYKKSDWSATGISTGALPQLNISGYPQPFLGTIRANNKCVGSDAVTVSYDGVSCLNVAIGGESAGEWVDVTGGGWFELLSGGGQKGLLVAVTWSGRPPTAISSTAALPASLTFEHAITGLGSPYFAALARLGYADHDLYAFGITSNTLSNIRARNHMIIALAPDIALFHCGINSLTTNSLDDVLAIVRDLNAVGTFVVWSTFIPYAGADTDEKVKKLVWWNNRILQLPKLYPELGMMVIDGGSRFFVPQVASGSGIVNAYDFASDGLHPPPSAIINRFMPVALDALSRLLPKLGSGRISTAMDQYDATNNPTGNRAGAAGFFAGTSGTPGTAPVPSGQLPSSWVDSTTTPGNPFASVVYTPPTDGAAVPRDDGPGNWFRAQYNIATVGNSDRMLKLTLANTFNAKQKYRLRLTVRLKNTSALRMLQGSLFFGSSGGRSINGHALLQSGFAPISPSASIPDSGPMYLASDEVAVPDDFNGTAYITIWTIVGLGGSADMYLADAIVEQVT